MALKVELKPGERIILGDCVVTNAGMRTRLLIEGSVPILREKDIMTAETANSPAQRVYLAVQLMYTARDASVHHEIYFKLIGEFLLAAPSSWPIIEAINNQILTGNLYKALKEARRLIAYEGELIANAKRRTSVREGGERRRDAA